MRGWVLAAALAIAAPASLAQDPAPGPELAEIRDEDLRFLLKRPGRSWVLLNQESAAEIVPDAVAGASSPGGSFAVLIVEHVGAVDPLKMLELQAQIFTLEDPEFGEPVKARVAGVDAMKRDIVCRFRGAPARFRIVAVPRPPFLYTWFLFCLTGPGQSGERTLEEPLASFSFLPGEVRPRRAEQTVQEAEGVGWRIRAGVFESAVAGIRVAPPSDWRLAIGPELKRMDAESEVGLLRTFPDVYATVSCRPAPGNTAATVSKSIHDGIAQWTRAIPGAGPVVVELSGEKVALEVRVGGDPVAFVYWIGTLARGERVYSIQLWCIEHLRAEAEKLLPAACAAIQVLPDPECRALAIQTAAIQDPHADCAPDASYRDGAYRNYSCGLQWKRPPGFWRVRIAEEATAVDAGATLVLTEPTLGVTGILAVVALEDLAISGEDAWDEEVRGWFGPPAVEDANEDVPGVAPSPKEEAPVPPVRTMSRARVPFAGRPAWESRLEWQESGSSRTTTLTTFISQGRGIALWFSANGDLLKRAEPAVRQALAGFTFVTGMKAEERTGRTYLNRRLGFSIELTSEQVRVDDMSHQLGYAGSLLFWKEERATAGVVAVAMPPTAGTPDKFVVRMLSMVIPASGLRIQGEPEHGTASLGGLPARKITWRAANGGSIVVVHVRRGNIVLVVIAGLDPGAPPERAEFIRGRVRLLE